MYALIVEDVSEQRSAMRRMLRPHFEQVVVSADVQGALEALAGSAPFRFFLLDVVLPDDRRGGVTLLDTARERFPRATVVVVSGAIDGSVINAVARRGAAFLAKPFGRAELEPFVARARSVGETSGRISARVAEAVNGWRLAAQEERLLACHVDGVSKLETCKRLGIGPRTHQTYVRRILAKTASAGEPFRTLSDVIVAVHRGRR